MVRAVGEMASMQRHKLWKTGKDGLCCSSSAIQTRLGPSTLLEERSEIPEIANNPLRSRTKTAICDFSAIAELLRWIL